MSDDPKSIYDLISENCERFSALDDAEVANRVIAEVGRDWKRLMFPLVASAVWNHRRANVRSIEQRATGRRSAGANAVHVVRHDSSDLAVFVSLLDKTVKFGGVDVAWGDVTVEQHKLRREALQAHIDGTTRTRDLHDFAIVVCESRGVDSLRPLFAKGVAA